MNHGYRRLMEQAVTAIDIDGAVPVDLLTEVDGAGFNITTFVQEAALIASSPDENQQILPLNGE